MTRLAASITKTSGGHAVHHAIRIPVFVAFGVIGSAPALAQVGLVNTLPTTAPGWRVTPSIRVMETLTDNVALAPDATKKSDLITQITPAVRVSGGGARVRLDLNYQMNGVIYANTSSRNEIQNFLSALANVEAVDNWLFVDAQAHITQQPISAFRAQPTTTGNINDNRAETQTYRLSPYVVGRFSNVADYTVRYSYTTTNPGGGAIGDSQLEELDANFVGVTGGRLGWTLNARERTTKRDEGRDIQTRVIRGFLTYQIDPQFRASAIGGWESNNFAAANRDSAIIYGGRLQWTPTERTQVDAMWEKRSFGDTHEFIFNHRTPLSSWQFSDRKTVTSLPEQLALGRVGTAFDLLFDALTSQIPDPILRREEVERRLESSGIPPDLLLASTFLTNRVLLQRTRSASVGILGVRNTLTLAARLTESQAIDNTAGVSDDFSLASRIEQQSLTASWSHRLSGLTTVNLLASHIRNSSEAGIRRKTDQSTARLLFTHRLGPKTTGTLGVRYTRFDDGPEESFREKALTASLLVTF